MLAVLAVVESVTDGIRSCLHVRATLGSIAPMSSRPDEASILAIDRPDPKLWTYYILCCLAVCRWRRCCCPSTGSGITHHAVSIHGRGSLHELGHPVSPEILPHYARIQDIHLHSNLVGALARTRATADPDRQGSASAEMTLEGPHAVRGGAGPVLPYAGVKEAGALVPAADHESSGPVGEDLAAILREIAHELRELRAALPSESTAKERPPHV